MHTCVDVATCVDEAARRSGIFGKMAWAEAVASTGGGSCTLVRCSFWPRTPPELKEKQCFFKPFEWIRGRPVGDACSRAYYGARCAAYSAPGRGRQNDAESLEKWLGLEQ